MDITPKLFVVIPADVYEVLSKRYATQDEAESAATEACADTDIRHIVVEAKAVAARADRPVTLRKL